MLEQFAAFPIPAAGRRGAELQGRLDRHRRQAAELREAQREGWRRRLSCSARHATGSSGVRGDTEAARARVNRLTQLMHMSRRAASGAAIDLRAITGDPVEFAEDAPSDGDMSARSARGRIQRHRRHGQRSHDDHRSAPRRALAEGARLPEVRMHLHGPADPARGVVVSNERCTAGKSHSFVRHVVIDVSGSRLEGSFRAGQSFGVIPPGADEAGRAHKLRLYSIASPSAGEDGQGRHVATTVKRTIDEHWETQRLFLGVASNYLADLRPGDSVGLTGPSGKRFLVPEDPGAHDYLFIATGTGIAPFRGMLRELDAAGFPSRAVLVMGSPYATDLIYDDQMRELASRRPGFSYLTALSRQPQTDGAADVRGCAYPPRSDRGMLARRHAHFVCGGRDGAESCATGGGAPRDVLSQYVRPEPAAGSRRRGRDGCSIAR